MKSPVFTSIETRLDRAMRALTIIAAASSSESVKAGSLVRSMPASEILRAITPVALDAGDELYWLSLLPAVVTELPAPTDDEVDVKDPDGVRRKLIDAALRKGLQVATTAAHSRKSGAR
jgi:hypothetical protein